MGEDLLKVLEERGYVESVEPYDPGVGSGGMPEWEWDGITSIVLKENFGVSDLRKVMIIPSGEVLETNAAKRGYNFAIFVKRC